MTAMTAITGQAVKIGFFIVVFRLVDVAVSIRDDDVRSGFAGQCVNDRRRHPHVFSVAGNYAPAVRGSNQVKRNGFTRSHRMRSGCGSSYVNELAYAAAANTLCIFNSSKADGSRAVAIKIAPSYRKAKRLVRTKSDDTRVESH
jgi:hypothetical protein